MSEIRDREKRTRMKRYYVSGIGEQGKKEGGVRENLISICSSTEYGLLSMINDTKYLLSFTQPIPYCG